MSAPSNNEQQAPTATPRPDRAEQERWQRLGEEAIQAFERDLPKLLQERPGQWVVYRGSQQLGFAATPEELYQRCFQQGMRDGEFLTFCIEPPIYEVSVDTRMLT